MKSVIVLHHVCKVNEQDEVKMIGVYANQAEANQAIQRLRDCPGFKEYPDGFESNEYEINKDHWAEGFVTLTSIMVPAKLGGWKSVQAECLKEGQYRIIEFYEAESLGAFKHNDVVECAERDGDLFAIRKVY